MPKVAVVALDTLAPTPLDTPFHREGLAVHKRAISQQVYGAERLDAGYCPSSGHLALCVA